MNLNHTVLSSHVTVQSLQIYYQHKIWALILYTELKCSFALYRVHFVVFTFMQGVSLILSCNHFKICTWAICYSILFSQCPNYLIIFMFNPLFFFIFHLRLKQSNVELKSIICSFVNFRKVYFVQCLFSKWDLLKVLSFKQTIGLVH